MKKLKNIDPEIAKLIRKSIREDESIIDLNRKLSDLVMSSPQVYRGGKLYERTYSTHFHEAKKRFEESIKLRQNQIINFYNDKFHFFTNKYNT